MKIVFTLFLLVLSLQANVPTQQIYTPEEKAWIKQNPIIKVGVEKDWMPFDYVDEKGVHQGISQDYLDEISRLSGLEFHLYPDNWSTLLEKIKTKQIDLLPALYYSDERSGYIEFTKSYLKLAEYLFTLKTTQKVTSPSESFGKTIAVVKGFEVHQWLKKRYPKIKVVAKDTLLECLQALSSGEVYGFIGDLPSTQYLQEKYFITNIKANRIISERDPVSVYMGVQKDKKILASIISKSFESITRKKKEKIFQKYASGYKKTTGLRGAFGFGRPPYMYDRNSGKGIEEALVRRAFSTRSIEVSEVRQMPIERGQKVLLDNLEMDFSVGVLEDKKDGLFYSMPFIKYENVAITRKEDHIKLAGIHDLKKYKVLAWKNAHKMLGEDFKTMFKPSAHPSSYKELFDQDTQHKQFFEKLADVILVDRNVFQWYVNRYKYNQDDFEIHPIFDKPTWVKLSFRSEFLRNEFNKGLQNIIKNREYDEIIKAFLKVDLQKQLDLTELIASLSAEYIFSHNYEGLVQMMNKFKSIKIIKGIEILNKRGDTSFIKFEKLKGSYQKVDDFSWRDSQLNMIKKSSYLHNKEGIVHVAEVKVYFEVDDFGISYIPKLQSFKDLSEAEFKQVKSVYKLLGLNASENRLTIKEQQWIQKHKEIRFVGDPNWLPFEGFDAHGNYIGIVAEYLNAIEEITGLHFKRIHTASWEESIDMMKHNKADMISETVDSKMRSYLHFTKPLIEDHIVIVMDSESRYVDKLSLIADKRIVVIKDYGYVAKIKKAYKGIEFIEVQNIQEGLNKVSSGQADALLCTMALGSYHITKDGFINLRIVGKTEFSTSLGFGVNKDFEPLVGILNKAISNLEEGKKQAILKKWITQKYVEKVDYTLVWQIAGVASVFLLLFWYWNRQMKKEIGRRKEAEDKLQEANSMMKDSIEFSSMIQQALLPTKESFQRICPDAFALWKPRDIVGGDIYFIEPLRHEKEILMMMIDCTGHGVPGAFVTMLVKAIERNVVGYIKASQEKVSPAEILGIFNRSVKHLLKQEDKDALSNAGFDAAIVYINKEENLFIYAGAEIPLFYCNEEDEIAYIKADRHSIGYRTSRSDFVFKDHSMRLDKIKSFYLSTDGYIDQNGGEKGFPFGRKRFMHSLQEFHNLPMHTLSQRLEQRLQEYQGGYERNDDIAIVGVRVDGLFHVDEVNTEQEVLLTYKGVITQEKMCSFQDEVEAFLDAKEQNPQLKEKVFAILTEQMQNIMSYAKGSSDGYKSEGEISFGFDKGRQKYFLRSANRMSSEDEKALNTKLIKVNSLSKTELKEYYRALRKSGSAKHEKGAGLGFLEMAKRASERIEYNIEKISATDSLFVLMVYI